MPKSDAPSGIAALQGLDELVPRSGPGFVASFLLSATRRNAAGWLGRRRLQALAAGMGADEEAAAAVVDRLPRPPAALGEASAWFARKVPLMHRDGRVGWTDLFWRPDRDAWQRGLGAFALRLVLPGAGRVEIRGRLEEARLDMVLHTEQTLPPAMGVSVAEAFGEILTRLGLLGEISLRGAGEERRS